jgi:signal transduction histidine kinase
MDPQVQILSLSQEIMQAIAQSTTSVEFLNGCAQALEQQVQAVSVGFWTLNSQTDILELQLMSGLQAPPTVFPTQASLAISLIGLIAQNRQPYITCEVLQNICLIEAREWLRDVQIQTFAGYPLLVAGQLVGVVGLLHPEYLDETVLTGIETLAPAIAATLDRLEARTELLSRNEAILFRLASHMRNSLDLDTILQAAVAEIRQVLHLDRCCLLWCWNYGDNEGTLQSHMAITHEAKIGDLSPLLGECRDDQVNILRDLILNLDPVVVEDVNQSLHLEPSLQQLIQEWGMTSVLLIPLETRSRQLGAIIGGHVTLARSWNSSEIKLLQVVTDQLAIAMEQADLYAQTRASALAAQTQAAQLQKVLENLQQAQAQLIQSEKMYSLGQLVAGIAHEINNPVNFINGNLQYAQEYFEDLVGALALYQQVYPEPPEVIQDYLTTVDLEFIQEDCGKMLASMRIGTNRIRDIVLSLRNFSRLDEAEVKSVNIHEGLDSTLLILENRIKPHSQDLGITIVKQYHNLPLVECYAGQLNQVFMNLLNNAIDALHHQPQPRQITITTDLIPPPDFSLSTKQWVEIRIRDNGSGIPEEIQQHIFDPFFTTKPVGEGTGLGLSMSYKVIVEKHQGMLTCHSELGQGSEFIIQIPVKLQDA